MKECWLMDGCPSRSGACYSCVPDGDDCPIWRWFKNQIIVRCKDCKYGFPLTDSAYIQCMCAYHDGHKHNHDWFCADGKRKSD